MDKEKVLSSKCYPHTHTPELGVCMFMHMCSATLSNRLMRTSNCPTEERACSVTMDDSCCTSGAQRVPVYLVISPEPGQAVGVHDAEDFAFCILPADVVLVPAV